VLSNLKIIILVTDSSVKPQPHLQAIFIAAGWKSGFQILSSKTVSGSITAPDAKLVTIRIGIRKASTLEANRLIIITGSLIAAKKAVGSSHYSGLGESLIIASHLRSFFDRFYKVLGLP